MSFCTNCGTELPEGTKFCTNCGAKIEMPTPHSVQETMHEEQPQSPMPANDPFSSAPLQPIDNPIAYQTAQQSFNQTADAQNCVGMQQNAVPAEPPAYTEQTPVFDRPTADEQTYGSTTGNTGSPQQSSAAQEPVSSHQTNQEAQTPQSGSGRKPVDKKLIGIIAGIAGVVVLVLCLIFGLGVKKGVDDPNLGVYTCESFSLLGEEYAAEDVYEKPVRLELKEGGKLVLDVEGDVGEGTWRYEENTIVLSGEGEESIASIENGRLVTKDLFGTGMDFVFVKEGLAVPAASGTSTASALAGKYNGTWFGTVMIGECTGDYAKVNEFWSDAYVDILVDAEGKGSLVVYTELNTTPFLIAHVRAGDETLAITDGEIMGYSMEDDNLGFHASSDCADNYWGFFTVEDLRGSATVFITMKPWGKSWQEEIDDDLLIVPRGLDEYEARIANGESAPVLH